MKKNILIAASIAVLATGGYWGFRQNTATVKDTPQEQTAQPKPYFLFLSDVHLDTQSDTTVYGGDTGMDLWAAFLDKVHGILKSSQPPAFIVYTGDLPAHYKCTDGCYLPPDGRAGHSANIATILNALRDMAEQNHIPLFYLPGNNDALAGDYYSFADEKQVTPLSLVPDARYFFPDSAGTPGTKAPCMLSDPHPTLGFYAAAPIAGLRLIALNTVIYSGNFTAVDGTTQLADGNTQMSWLSAQLADAAAKNEKVYLAMHVPPGTDAYSGNTMWAPLPTTGNTWAKSFLSLTTQYKETIAGILYGHTHMDEVRRIYDTTGTQITEVAISCPGVTPQHKNNPGFKTVQYDATSMELLDFTTFFTTPAGKVWSDSSYTFSAVYGSTPGTSVYQCLSNMTLPAITNCMNYTFTVRHGGAGYDIGRGIEVR